MSPFCDTWITSDLVQIRKPFIVTTKTIQNTLKSLLNQLNSGKKEYKNVLNKSMLPKVQCCRSHIIQSIFHDR